MVKTIDLSQDPASKKIDITTDPNVGRGVDQRHLLPTYSDIGHDFMEANRQSGKQLYDVGKDYLTHFGSEGHAEPTDVLMAAANRLGAPLSAPFTSLIGRPAEYLSGGRVKKEDVGAWSSMVLPFVGEAAVEANLAREASQLSKATGMSEAMSRKVIKAQRAPSPVPPDPKTTIRRPRNEEQQAQQQAAGRLVDKHEMHLTTAQREGGVANEIERERAVAHPYEGPPLQRIFRKQVGQFNRAVFNDALSHIDERLDDDTGLSGQAGMAVVKEKFNAAYDKILKNAKAVLNPQLIKSFQDLKKLVPKERQADFDALIKQEVLGKFTDAERTMFGSSFKRVQRHLRDIIGTNINSTSGVDSEYGAAVQKALQILRDNLTENSPKDTVARLKRADEGYAKYVRTKDAVAYAGKEHGEFTPAQLIQALKLQKNNREAFIHDDAFLQELAQDAHSVLGSDQFAKRSPKAGWIKDVAGSTIGLLGGTSLAGLAHGGGLDWLADTVGALAGTPLGFAATRYLEPRYREFMDPRIEKKLYQELFAGRPTPFLKQALKTVKKTAPKAHRTLPIAGGVQTAQSSGSSGS